MKIFKGVEELLNFIDSNEELYIDNCLGNDGKDMVREVVKKNGDGFYCLDFGSRGEVEFNYVDDFVKELNEWNKIEDDEFKYMRGDVGSEYLDLNWYEECIRCYFLVVGV